METIKTSKIKTVVRTKPFTNNYGTTIYHDLLMENGDKIQIGKKAEQKAGWELTYSVVDEGQEYNKAKSEQKQETPVQNNGSGLKNESFEVVKQRYIVAQNSVTNAVNYHSIHNPVEDKDVLVTAQKFYDWVMSKGGENGSN